MDSLSQNTLADMPTGIPNIRRLYCIDIIRFNAILNDNNNEQKFDLSNIFDMPSLFPGGLYSVIIDNDV